MWMCTKDSLRRLSTALGIGLVIGVAVPVGCSSEETPADKEARAQTRKVLTEDGGPAPGSKGQTSKGRKGAGPEGKNIKSRLFKDD